MTENMNVEDKKKFRYAYQVWYTSVRLYYNHRVDLSSLSTPEHPL